MLKARHYSAAMKSKGEFTLPARYDGTVNKSVLYHAVRGFLSAQRQGTHSTKTRSQVSGGRQKPWRQKGTGRARQGSIRAAHWRGGGIVFGPKPRSYRLELPRKARRLARQSALNARAREGAIYVLESLPFEEPKTARMLELLAKLGLDDKKVLVLTAQYRSEVYLSGRNLQRVHVTRYDEATAYEVLWADALVIEEAAVADGTPAASGEGPSTAAKPARTRTAKRSGTKTVKRGATKKKTVTRKKTGTKKKRVTKRKETGDA